MVVTHDRSFAASRILRALWSKPKMVPVSVYPSTTRGHSSLTTSAFRRDASHSRSVSLSTLSPVLFLEQIHDICHRLSPRPWVRTATGHTRRVPRR